MEKDAPKVVKIHDVNIDQEYAQWLNEIKARYRNAQIKASIKGKCRAVDFQLATWTRPGDTQSRGALGCRHC